MRQVLAKRLNDQDWSKQFVDDSHYDVCYNEDVIARREDGSILMVLLKNVISREINGAAWSVLNKYNPKTENRSVASGIDAVPRKKTDGTMSSVTRVPKGWEVTSGVIGYFERTLRIPYAHACAWNEQNPDKFQRLLPLVERVNKLFKQHCPEKWRFQKSFVDKTPPEYLIGDSVFTTLTVNKNFRTSCHKDAGDLEGGISCMSVIRKGAYKGAILALPNYRIAADVQMGDLIMFDPHEFHGNTQIIPVTPDAVRCSIVFYYREMMQYCLPPALELKRVQNRKAGDPLFDKGPK